MATFKKRAGTTSKGTGFENLHIANFVLQLVSNPKIEDFHLSSNDESYGAFDDIVVETVHEQVKEIYALQLKHKDKEKLAIKILQQRTGDFAIAKYFDSFEKCKGKAQKFILFTNLKFEVKDNQPFQLEGENFYVILSKFYPEDVFKISEDANYCYKFSIVEDTLNSQNSARIQEYKTFFDNFFLYVDQKNVMHLKASTEKKFTDMFLSNKKEFVSYLNMISEWSMQVGNKEKLNKQWMPRAIAIQLLSLRTKPLSFVEVNENRKILRRAISEFDITVFENNTNGKESELWGDAKETIKDFKEINRIRTKYQLSSTYIDNLNNADPKLLSQLFWLMGKCPLIVREDQTVHTAIQLCFKDKFIVLGKGRIKEWQNDLSVFQNLRDLQTHSNVYNDLMTNFTCSLQGKQALSLQIIFTQNEEVLNSVKTDYLLEMLEGPYNIGGKKEDLPEPYIDRFLLRNVIDIRYLEKIDKDTLIILNCGNKLKDLKRKLTRHKFINSDEQNVNAESFQLGHLTNSNLRIDLEKSGLGSTIYTSKDECSLDKFKTTCNKNTEGKNCHQFRYRNDGNLDWIRSKNDVSDLENYKMFNKFVEEKVLWSSQPDNNINVIIGDPGMGKTELIKSLKNKCASGFWTVVVYPKDIYSFFKNLENRNNLVEDFEHFTLNEKFGSLKELDKEILKTSIKQHMVIYVWDALDEVSSDHLEDVTHMILQLSEKNFLQWVTSRQHLKKFLETKFNVLSITISQFNEDEQRFYIKERLEASSKEENEQIINKIQSVFTLIEHKDILGIPLQIFMLTEILRQNKNKYLDLLNNEFALTDLYHYFIDEKTSTYYRERAGLDIQTFQSEILLRVLKLTTLENHEKYALKALFSEETLSRLKINCETELQTIQTNNSAVGIITEVTNGIPRFLHASFAEYLVALYFSKNLAVKDTLVEIIFQQKYVNIRLFFDLLLAKSSPPHIAILYNDFDFLEKCDKKILKLKDVGGRSVLHLACSWGQRYPLLTVEESEDTYLIDDVSNTGVTAEAANYLDIIGYLADQCDILENDTLFNMTPLSYAQKSDCLFAKLKILQKQKTQLSSSDSVSINILYYSARFGYSDALDLFTAENLPLIKTKKSGCSLLYLACGDAMYIAKLLETDTYKNEINDKDSTGNTPLHIAAYNNYSETVIMLILYGAQINVENSRTPLWLASYQGHDEIVEILTQSGADTNLTIDDGITPLLVAAQRGQERIVEILIKYEADINLPMNDGITPLFAASHMGYEKMVETLIKSGADTNIAMLNGATPLFVASQVGHEKIVEILIKSGADSSLTWEENITPLFMASQNGHEEIVEILLKSGAEINLAKNNGTTPMFVASQQGHEKTVEILLQWKPDVNLGMENGITPLFIAAFKGHEKIVEMLTKPGVGTDINFGKYYDGATSLHAACQQGHEKVAEILIKSGADANFATFDGTTPLCIASEMGHERIVEILIKYKADINRPMNDGTTPLSVASKKGYEKIVEILVKYGADINLPMINGATPLFVASQVGHEKIAEILINSGADSNLTWVKNMTPLFMASQAGHAEIVEILITSEADINLPMDNGATPIFVASQLGYERIVETLLQWGADVDLAIYNGITPLFIASFNGQEKIVEILTKSGAGINLAMRDGTAPLHIASRQGHEKIAEILIKSGADINLATDDGKTPLYIASEMGHGKTVEILIKSEADTNLATNVGTTPLYIASEMGREKTVEILTKSGANINLAMKNGAAPLHVAFQKGYEKITDILIKSGADANLPIHGSRLLIIASEEGNEKVVEILIKAGADINLVNDNGATPLFVASQNGHEKTVEILTKSGADINLAMPIDAATSLHAACQRGHDKIAEILIKCEADINLATFDGTTPLYVASEMGHKKTVEILTSAGANIDLAKYDDDVTPLIIASHLGHEKIVESLITSGADINLANNEGATPLFIASLNGHEKTVESLLTYGADINQAANFCNTPLFIASQEGHEKIVEILIRSGADINFATNRDATPLFIASQEGHERIVDILLKSGADINRAMDDGDTPLFIACKNGHDKTVEVLMRSEADINLANYKSGATPLFIASQNGHKKIVKSLILNCADASIARNDDTTPFEIALKNERMNLLELLTFD